MDIVRLELRVTPEAERTDRKSAASLNGAMNRIGERAESEDPSEEERSPLTAQTETAFVGFWEGAVPLRRGGSGQNERPSELCPFDKSISY